MLRVSRCLLALLTLSLVPALASADERFEGQTLISPFTSNQTQLIEMDGTVARIWTGAATPATSAHLLADGSILRPCAVPGGAFPAPGIGGRIQRIDASDSVVWDFQFSSADHVQHHAIAPMPSGNVLLIAWERKTPQEVVQAGRIDDVGEMWPLVLVEVEPVGATGGNVVWEWHIWDHLVQDVDPGRSNFGVVGDHPELVDVNAGEVIYGGDWIHANAIDYDPVRDQILFSSRNLDELFVIDHSTTTAEAAGSTGGLSGMGGDILYRWGNPQNYDRGDASDRYFFVVHGANFVDAGLPGAGNILAYNNGDREGSASDYATVVEIAPPRDGDWNYSIAPAEAFGPVEPAWYYGDPGTFYGGPTQGSAQRLPNGNTLIAEGITGNLREVSVGRAIVWQYSHGEPVGVALRYWEATTAVLAGAGGAGVPALLANQPNPFNPFTTVGFDVPAAGRVTLTVFDVRGRRVAELADGIYGAGRFVAGWDGRDDGGREVASGTYFVRMEAGDFAATRKMTLTR